MEGDELRGRDPRAKAVGIAVLRLVRCLRNRLQCPLAGVGFPTKGITGCDSRAAWIAGGDLEIPHSGWCGAWIVASRRETMYDAK